MCCPRPAMPARIAATLPTQRDVRTPALSATGWKAFALNCLITAGPLRSRCRRQRPQLCCKPRFFPGRASPVRQTQRWQRWPRQTAAEQLLRRCCGRSWRQAVATQSRRCSTSRCVWALRVLRAAFPQCNQLLSSQTARFSGLVSNNHLFHNCRHPAGRTGCCLAGAPCCAGHQGRAAGHSGAGGAGGQHAEQRNAALAVW